jgi:hypothetical protein
MHTIQEEDEEDEQSNDSPASAELDIGMDMAEDSTPNTSMDLKGSFPTMNSANQSMDYMPSTPNMSSSRGPAGQMGSKSQNPGTPSNSSPIPVPVYSDPNMKDGHVLFNYLRSDVAKNMPGKANIKPEVFMDKITFMGRRLVHIWFGKEISVEQFNIFSDLLRDKIYLLSFPLMLEAFKKLGHFNIKESGFKNVCDLMHVCLTQCYLCRSVSIPLVLLSIASNCYSTIDGKITYVREGIKSHQIFKNDPKFWEACILFKTFTNKPSEDKNKQNVFYSTIVRNILSVAYYMNDILKEKQLIRDVCFRFLSPSLYKVPEMYASDLVQYIQSVMKSSQLG